MSIDIDLNYMRTECMRIRTAHSWIHFDHGNNRELKMFQHIYKAKLLSTYSS